MCVCVQLVVYHRESDRSNRFYCLFPKFWVRLFYFPHFFLGRLFPNRRRLDGELCIRLASFTRVSHFSLFKKQNAQEKYKSLCFLREKRNKRLCVVVDIGQRLVGGEFFVFFFLFWKDFTVFDSCLKEREREFRHWAWNFQSSLVLFRRCRKKERKKEIEKEKKRSLIERSTSAASSSIGINNWNQRWPPLPYRMLIT